MANPRPLKVLPAVTVTPVRGIRMVNRNRRTPRTTMAVNRRRTMESSKRHHNLQAILTTVHPPGNKHRVSPGASLETARQAISEALSGKSIGSYGNVGEKLAELLCQNATESSFNGSGAAAPRLPTAQPLRNASGYDDISALRVHTAALRARLQGLVQASKQKRSTPASVGHRLDSRVLTRLRVGDTRVFNRKEEKRAVNTAVCMLLDSSGSMGNSSLQDKMGIASRACFVASEALYSIPGVRTAYCDLQRFRQSRFPHG